MLTRFKNVLKKLKNKLYSLQLLKCIENPAVFETTYRIMRGRNVFLLNLEHRQLMVHIFFYIFVAQMIRHNLTFFKSTIDV